jgi:hypothetical protein
VPTLLHASSLYGPSGRGFDPLRYSDGLKAEAATNFLCVREADLFPSGLLVLASLQSIVHVLVDLE